MKVLLLLLKLFYTMDLCCQLNQDSFVVWNSNYKLKIEDFKGNPKTLTKNDIAAVACGYSAYIDEFESRKEIIVFCRLSKYKSTKKYDTLNAYDINHEQKHFDLYEVYVRKLRALVFSKHKAGISTELFTKLKFKYQDMADIANDLYDKETRHGENRKKQVEWDKKIAKWLKELEQYADPKIVIYQKNKL